MDKNFINLLNATLTKAEGLNEAWAKVIAYAVKKAFAAKDSTYAQAAVDSAPAGVRKGVAASLKKLGVLVNSAPNAQFTVAGVRDPSKQAEVFAKIAAGDIQPVIAMADKTPVAAKTPELVGTPRQRAEKAAAAVLARLKGKDPAAAAEFNDMTTKFATNAPMLRTPDGVAIELDNSEVQAMAQYLTELRMAKAAPALLRAA